MPPNTTGEARAYPRPLPNPGWLGKRTEEILQPDLPIIDPHHHLWDHPGSRYLLDELLADVNSGHNIVKTVFIQCGSGYRASGPEEMRPIGESEFVQAIAEEGDRRGGKTKICAGIVSFADLRLSNVDAVLDGQIAAAGGRFRGIRQIAAHDPAIIGASSYVPPPGLMNDPNFRRGLKRLPAHNLTFEAWIYHPQIRTLTEVARECPEVKIVLNHFGGPLGVGPYKRNEVFPQWRADIRALAACPNVYVKLGGLAMIVNAFDFHFGATAAIVGRDGQCVATLCRSVYREFRRQPLHVRKQLPGRQGCLQLSGAVQRVQAARRRRLGSGKGRTLCRHRIAVLPAGVVTRI